jgi:Mg-chelatase subunit ChlD
LRTEIHPVNTQASIVKDPSPPPSNLLQRRDLTEIQNKGLDTIFVLDCSRSMGEKLDSNSKSTKLDICKTALVSALSRASENNCPDRIGLLAVYTNILAKPIISVVMKFHEISKARSGSIPIEDIISLRAQGSTALYAAISEATKILAINRTMQSVSQQIILITDSKNNTGEQPMKILAESIKNRTKIHVIDLGNRKVAESLKMICDATGGQFFFVTNATDLQSNLYSTFSNPPESQKREDVDPRRSYFSAIYADRARPPVIPKRRKAETVEEIRLNLDQIKNELRNMGEMLKSGQINQMQYTERYSILQFDLQELRQSIRELRSKLSRELAEYTLSQENVPGDSLSNSNINEHLLELDQQRELLKQSASFVS